MATTPAAGNLDEQLENILLDSQADFLKDNLYNIEIREKAIEYTKQAFKDAGWYHSPLVDHQVKRIESGELMTGQEWYDKFSDAMEEVLDKALDKLVDSVLIEDNPESVDFRKAKREVEIIIDEVAKKVSGVQD